MLQDFVSIKLRKLLNCLRLATRSFPTKAKYAKNQQNPTRMADRPLFLDTPTPPAALECWHFQAKLILDDVRNPDHL